MIVCVGDLLLDVIVRLSQPLAEGADADAVTKLGPGGQAANVAAWIAELGGDILDISQTLVGDYFTMIIVIDTASLDAPFATFKDQIEAEAHDMGLQTMMMHEDVVSSLHRV